MEKFLVSCQAGKETIHQGILHQNEQSQDHQTNTTGPTSQQTRTNMPTHNNQPKLTEKKTRILDKQEILNRPKQLRYGPKCCINYSNASKFVINDSQIVSTYSKMV